MRLSKVIVYDVSVSVLKVLKETSGVGTSESGFVYE